MTWKTIARKSLTIILAGTLLFSITACGSDTAGKKTGSAKSGSDSGKKTITVQTADTFDPDGFLNEDGEADGFEIDVFKAIAEITPQYDFKYEAVSIENLTTNLASGRSDVAALEFGRNEEREANFTITNESYSTLVTRFIVLADNEEYDANTTIDDFQGKTVYCVKGDDANAILEYNDSHKENPINIEYVSDPATCVNDLVSGKADAFIRGEVAIISYGDAYGVKLKGIAAPVRNVECFFLLPKNADKELVDAIDSAVKTLKENGELAKIHKKWHHDVDYTPPYEYQPVYNGN